MKWKSLSVAAAALAVALAPAAMAGTVEVSPSSQSVALGGQATVDIFALGLGNGSAPALAAFDLTLFFDSTILSPASLTFSSRLGDPNTEAFTLNSFVLSGPTVIGIQLQNISLLDGASLFALQTAGPGGFSLASITFDAIGTGKSDLSFFVASTSDESFNDLGLTGGTGSIDVTGASGVPEPGTWLLSGLGLAAAGILRRSRRQ